MRQFSKAGFIYFAFAVLLSSCASQSPKVEGERTPSITPSEAASSSNRFDASQIKVGDRVQNLTVQQVDVQTASDGTTVGTVRFQGEVTLSGNYLPHPAAPEVQAICFEPDAASAVQLPRFLNDDRKIWFCFDNQETATEQLGAIGSTGQATVVVDRYTTTRQYTDAADSAVLVRVVAK